MKIKTILLCTTFVVCGGLSEPVLAAHENALLQAKTQTEATAQDLKGPVEQKVHGKVLDTELNKAPIDQKIQDEKDAKHLTEPKSVKQRQAAFQDRHKRAEHESFAKLYGDFKNKLNEQMGLSYSLDVSVLGQRAAPNGKGTPWQTQYYGSIDWNMFKSKIGNGSLQFAYTNVHYWGKNGAFLGNRIGVANDVNDYTSNAHYFDQLTYTHQMPGDFSWLSLSFGQFPMYTWDGSQYNSNQQINFINMALSQNGSSTYPSASLGGFMTIEPNEEWTFVVGFQDANNISGSKINTHTFHEKKYTSFASLSYTPTIEGLGSGQYSLLVYNQPGVEAQPGTTNGWSVNISQNFGEKWAAFARVNGNTGNEPIKQSYVLGGVYNNPLNRNALDQIGFATAINKLNRTVNGPDTRTVETVLEGYWAWGLSNFVTLTPDVQFYINPGLDKDNKTATVASIRATFMF